MKSRKGMMILERIGGQLYLSPVKRKKRYKPTESQKRIQSKFSDAVFYARGQMDNPARRELYQRGVNEKKRSPYMVALTDMLMPPTVHKIGVNRYKGETGDCISIEATDDFEVRSVQVYICDSTGKNIEAGEAVQSETHKKYWMYTTSRKHDCTQDVKITATACDWAGNTHSLDRVISAINQKITNS